MDHYIQIKPSTLTQGIGRIGFGTRGINNETDMLRIAKTLYGTHLNITVFANETPLTGYTAIIHDTTDITLIATPTGE